MAECRKCVICSGSFVGVGNVCPGCEAAMERDPVTVRPRDPKDVLADISREVEARAKAESVSDILVAMRKLAGTLHEKERVEGYEIVDAWYGYVRFADRILAAHKREIGELNGERKGILKANAQFAADNTRLRGELAAKDAEIEKLKAYIAENDINGDTAVACLTEIKNAVDEKMAEIAKLRELVKGLLEASSTECADCRYDCGPDRDNCIIHEAAKYIEESEVK